MPKEVKQHVRTYRTKMICDCGGEMIAEDIILPTYPAQYPHTCNKCGKREVYDKRYPVIEYKTVY